MGSSLAQPSSTNHMDMLKAVCARCCTVLSDLGQRPGVLHVPDSSEELSNHLPEPQDCRVRPCQLIICTEMLEEGSPLGS